MVIQIVVGVIKVCNTAWYSMVWIVFTGLTAYQYGDQGKLDGTPNAWLVPSSTGPVPCSMPSIGLVLPSTGWYRPCIGYFAFCFFSFPRFFSETWHVPAYQTLGTLVWTIVELV